jgi:hypothetical protein
MNLNHSKLVGAIGLKITASWSPSMASQDKNFGIYSPIIIVVAVYSSGL